MDPKTPRGKGPEHIIQDQIVKMLRNLGWFTKHLHGGAFQSGMPDLFCCHVRYGIRLIEVKLPNMKGSRFTAAQLETFPLLTAHGCGVWVLTGATDSEYQKLFTKFNWYQYLDCNK